MKNPFVTHKDQLFSISKLAYPIVLNQLSVVLMGVIDTMMVGELGDDALASANQANNLFFMVSGLTFGILYAISTLVSIKVGQGKAKDGFITYRAGLIVALLLFVLQFAVIQLFVHNFHWLNQQGRINDLAPGFLNIISYSILPLLINVTTRQFTDGLGHTKVAVAISAGGLLMNVVLNYCWIYGNWGFEAMGVNGAAYATLVARIMMALAGLWYIRYSGFMKQYVPVKMPRWNEIKPELPQIWKIGIPVALQTFAEWACFGISGLMIGWFDSKQLAAHAVALNVASVSYMIVSGIAIAGSIVVGNAYGEQNKEKIRQLGHAVFLLIATFEVVNMIVIVLFNHQIAGMYEVSSNVMPIITPLFLLAAAFQIADGVQAGAMNMLRGVEDVNWASVLSIVSYWIVSLPLSYLFGITMGWEVYGVWLGFTVGLFVASITGTLRFYYRIGKLNF